MLCFGGGVPKHVMKAFIRVQRLPQGNGAIEAQRTKDLEDLYGPRELSWSEIGFPSAWSSRSAINNIMGHSLLEIEPGTISRRPMEVFLFSVTQGNL